MTDDTMVERIEALLTSSQHAPMEDHDPRDGGCRSCPWPLHALPPRDIATALLPLVREAQAEAVTAFIAEADKSPAITWTGKGGVKELATAGAATYRTGDDHAR